MRRIAYVAAAALLLGGCGGDDPPETPGPAPSASVAALSPPAGLPSGMVFLTGRYSSKRPVVTVHDIATGRQLAEAMLPQGATFVGEGSFDATMNRVAYVVQCELHLAELFNNEYAETARWAPPQAYGEGEQCFKDPAFGEDGLIHVRIGPGLTPSRVVAVDPAAPDAAVKDVGDESKKKETILHVPGVKDGEVRLMQAGDRIYSVRASGRVRNDDIVNSFRYNCSTWLDDTRVLCGSEHEDERQKYGSVALLTLDQAARTATLKQVAPTSRSRAPRIVLAPGGETIAIHDSTGWYTTGLDGSGTPARRPLSDATGLGDVLFWH